MKIVSLNIWGGRVGKPLLDFFEKQSDIDIFLLQEVFLHATEKTCWGDACRPNVFQEIADLLPDHTAHFAPSVIREWGLGAYIRSSIKVDEIGDVFVHKHMDALDGRDGSSIGRNLQYLVIQTEQGERYSVFNFHGLWTGTGKDDTEERINQSKKIVEYIKPFTGHVILCGDFNLSPKTQSMELIEREVGLRNLIKEYGITSTRTSYYKKPEQFADYILVSPEVHVKQFHVMPDEVSDHAPLLVEI